LSLWVWYDVHMTTATTKPDVRFLVDVYQPNISNCLAVTLTAVYVSEDGHIRNPHFSTYDPEKVAHLDSLKLDAQASKDSDDFYFGTYNVVHFSEVYTVDLSRAESVTKTLRRIQKYLDKQYEVKGCPADFAELAQRVARSLGIRKHNIFAFKVSGTGWSYDENTYAWMNEDELRGHLEGKLKLWKEGSL